MIKLKRIISENLPGAHPIFGSPVYPFRHRHMPECWLLLHSAFSPHGLSEHGYWQRPFLQNCVEGQSSSTPQVTAGDGLERRVSGDQLYSHDIFILKRW